MYVCVYIYVCVCVCIYICVCGEGSVCGEGNGNPLQYSYLENPRDGGAWWAAVYGVAQSRTRLKQLSSSISIMWNFEIIAKDLGE